MWPLLACLLVSVAACGGSPGGGGGGAGAASASATVRAPAESGDTSTSAGPRPLGAVTASLDFSVQAAESGVACGGAASYKVQPGCAETRLVQVGGTVTPKTRLGFSASGTTGTAYVGSSLQRRPSRPCRLRHLGKPAVGSRAPGGGQRPPHGERLLQGVRRRHERPSLVAPVAIICRRFDPGGRRTQVTTARARRRASALGCGRRRPDGGGVHLQQGGKRLAANPGRARLGCAAGRPDLARLWRPFQQTAAPWQLARALRPAWGVALALTIDFNLLANPAIGAVYVYTKTSGVLHRPGVRRRQRLRQCCAPGHCGHRHAVWYCVGVVSERQHAGSGRRAGKPRPGAGPDRTANRSSRLSGAAFVFSRSQGQWQEQSLIKASNPSDLDRSGAALAASSDGNTLAVGAPDEDGSSQTVDGVFDDLLPDSGAVYVYRRSAGVWAPRSSYHQALAGPGQCPVWQRRCPV